MNDKMLNVRLDKDTEKTLKQYSEQNNMSKTAVVKEALALYFTKETESKSPYELGGDLFGIEGSGQADRSTTYKAKLREKLHAKHSH
ncbi:MAG: CopG family transcriptional regulator [Reichenbachiella sp.]|uniref:CopG family transcriptional regulator n=1 Tax=Reichenbachiella sp. TaxID=2184521 RepID=UPI003266CE56